MSQYKEFEELGTSTKTVMVYANVNFDFKRLFRKLPITEVDVPLTKKKKLPDMKKVKAPRNAIISLRHGNEFRGIVTKPDIVKKEGGTNYFLNQTTCILSLGEKNLHIMIFKNKLKIAGSKETEQANEAVHLLWKHILKISKSYEMMENETVPRFIFDVVMTNVDFKLGFKIDRKKLNNLMNNPRYKKHVFMSRFETTGSTNVNIKMHCNVPDNFYYTCMILEEGKKPKFVKYKENIFDEKKDKKKEKYTTFLVFRSSKVIESGRYYESMRDSYNYFTENIIKYKDLIEEKIKTDDDQYVHAGEESTPLWKIIRDIPGDPTVRIDNGNMVEFAKMISSIKKNTKKVSDYHVSLHKLLKHIPSKCPECNSVYWWKDTYLDDTFVICGSCQSNVLDANNFFSFGKSIELY